MASEWAHDGPSLPVEFARQSRDGRMTLVISENTKAMPSHREVIRHLLSLKGFERQRAKEYVCRTPDEIRTAYRERIEESLGWSPE